VQTLVRESVGQAAQFWSADHGEQPETTDAKHNPRDCKDNHHGRAKDEQRRQGKNQDILAYAK
jgi:hypothetical protein